MASEPVPIVELRTAGDGPPRPVRDAAVLMRAGAALTVLRVLYALAISHPTRRDDVAPRLVASLLILVALWLWMARRNEAGRPWARTTATILAALNVLFLPVGLAYADDGNTRFYADATVAAGAAVSAVLGIVVVVLLYRPASTRWFARAGAGS